MAHDHVLLVSAHGGPWRLGQRGSRTGLLREASALEGSGCTVGLGAIVVALATLEAWDAAGRPLRSGGALDTAVCCGRCGSRPQPIADRA
jgi:hypothetical protein